MENDQLFVPIPHLQGKHRNKRGMPMPATIKRPTPAMHTADLTQAIIKDIRAKAGTLYESTIGIYGQKEARWRKSTTARGTADIQACIDGWHLSMEMKPRNDRQSDAQKLCEEQVVNSCGFYLIIHKFGEFQAWFRESKTKNRY